MNVIRYILYIRFKILVCNSELKMNRENNTSLKFLIMVHHVLDYPYEFM